MSTPNAVSSLHASHSKPPKPPDPRCRLSTSMTSWLVFAFLTLLQLSNVNGQTISTPASSTSSTLPTLSVSGLPILLNLPPLNSTTPQLLINLPETSPLYITLNICSLSSNTSLLPIVLLSTTSTYDLGTRSSNDFSTGGFAGRGNRRGKNAGTWKVVWNEGFGNWTGGLDGGDIDVGLLLGLGMGDDGELDSDVLGGVEGNVIVQLGVSTTGPLHYLSPSSPLLGDTTSISVLIFSPLLLSQLHDQPSYPNYTLPPPILNLPPYPKTQTNLTSLGTDLKLIIVPTTSSPTNDGLDNSLCAVQAANASTGGIASESRYLMNDTMWTSVGGEEGFRTMWVVGDLLAGTNYTAWIVDGEGGMSPPIWFATKDPSFDCPLILPTPLCPGVGYTAPLPRNTTQTTNGESYPLRSLPDNITSTLVSSFQAFSTSLLSQACGRDLFSQVLSCADCFAAYRDWACRIVIPQCATTTQTPSDGNIPTPQSVVVGDHSELLPCLSTCNTVDRSCPVFLGFRCPLRGNTANESYAFIGDDDDRGDGSEGAVDRWGNRWCNG